MRPALDKQGGSAAAAGFEERARLSLSDGNIEGAIEAYSKCVELVPFNAAIHNNLGALLVKAGRFRQATEMLQVALSLQPGYVRAMVNLGKALREQGRLAEAMGPLTQAVASAPDHAPALVNLAEVLAAQGELESAEQAAERAVEFAPTLVEAHMTLGLVRLQAGRVAESLTALRKALALAPDHADAHCNVAHALFVSGDWRAAWPHFEYRFRRHTRRVELHPPVGLPRWDGTIAAGQELWLMGEQGLGDQLQFVRYAHVLRERGVRCVIACHPRLVRILSSAELATRAVPFGTAAEEPTAQWIPMLSLAAWHGTQIDTVPLPEGYLVADPLLVGDWSRRLSNMNGLRVALAWAGNPNMETGQHAGRSPPLAALAPLIDTHNVSFVSVQKGAGEEQLDSVPFSASILRLRDLDGGPDAFVDTAAVLKCVDLLVTSDTAMAHLGGALGVPTWLCLTREPDWRWMAQGSSTPWYRSMRLFRQPGPGDWASVFSEVARALARCASGC